MRTSSIACAAAVLVAMLLAGCGSDIAQQVQQTAQDVQKSVTKTVDSATTQATEQLNMAGNSEVTTIDGPVKTPGCYAHFTPGSDGRSSVLALQSYKQAQAESFPSLYVRALVPAASITELVGQTVPAEMYLKSAAAGPTWHTPIAQLKIVSLADEEVVAEVISGTLTSSQGTQSQPAVAKFTAVLP